MLRYLGTGKRDYGIKPLRSYSRSVWEFEAVISGRCGPVVEGEIQPRLAANRLWLFHPQCRHGWGGIAGEPCEILVFHFSAVPEPVPQLISREGVISTDLSAADIRHLRRLAGEAAVEVAHPTSVSGLRFQRIQTELCLLVTRDCPARRLAGTERSAEDVCANALAWAEARLNEGVGVTDLAKAVHVSVAHLRRLFHQARDVSPQHALQAIRMRRAEELIMDDMLSLDAVASACGFASASALSRAFRSWHGLSPRTWRSRQHPRHNPGWVGD
ncbi:MAG: AraC family transcriptional regulator [Planctomycetota bacterium]|jgi:AraC-like DNA-binding protein|nr:AraC family transcriptional regulator [Planctomycetota bacterium]